MARAVDHVQARAAQIEDVPVFEAEGIGAGREVKLLPNRLSKRAFDRLGKAVDRHHGVQRADAGLVEPVQVPGDPGKQVIARDVVLVAVAVQHPVHLGRRPGPRQQAQRRIHDHPLLRAADEQRVGVGISATLAPEEHANGADLPDFEFVRIVLHFQTSPTPSAGERAA